MADYWASSAATGGGDGSINDEFTLAEGLGATGIQQGDRFLIKDDGTYNLTAKITAAIATYDWEDAPIVIGANSAGVIDGSVPVINGSGITTDDIFLFDQSGTRIQFINIRITAATASAIRMSNNVSGAAALSLKNCRIDNCSGAGIAIEETSTFSLMLFNSEIDNNGADGITGTVTIHVDLCKIHDNTNAGIGLTGNFFLGREIKRSLIYNNGANGVDIAGGSGTSISDCVFFNNTGDGVEFSSAQGFLSVVNTIFRNNGAYGIGGATMDSQFAFIDNNCYSGNTSGDVSWNGGTAPGDNNITADPKFTSETAGSEDFTLQSDSPCIDAGFGYDGAA